MIQENPQYFDQRRTLDNGQWNNWEDALIWLGVIVAIILALAVYKHLRKR